MHHYLDLEELMLMFLDLQDYPLLITLFPEVANILGLCSSLSHFTQGATYS